jgi:hypothetical protein
MLGVFLNSVSIFLKVPLGIRLSEKGTITLALTELLLGLVSIDQFDGAITGPFTACASSPREW